MTTSFCTHTVRSIIAVTLPQHVGLWRVTRVMKTPKQLRGMLWIGKRQKIVNILIHYKCPLLVWGGGEVGQRNFCELFRHICLFVCFCSCYREFVRIMKYINSRNSETQRSYVHASLHVREGSSYRKQHILENVLLPASRHVTSRHAPTNALDMAKISRHTDKNSVNTASDFSCSKLCFKNKETDLFSLYVIKQRRINCKPITAFAGSKAWTVFARSNTGIVGSNPTQGMGVCLRLFCVCIGSGIATGWSPVQRVLPTVLGLKNWSET
jgi:hypothetical protein